MTFPEQHEYTVNSTRITVSPASFKRLLGELRISSKKATRNSPVKDGIAQLLVELDIPAEEPQHA